MGKSGGLKKCRKINVFSNQGWIIGTAGFCEPEMFESVKRFIYIDMSGNVEMIRNACYHTDMSTREELIRIKEESGMSWRSFAEYFAIPYRTMQDWQLGNRRMPEYLLRLMLYRLEIEKLTGLDENGFTPEEGKELVRRIAEIKSGHIIRHALIEE